MHHYQIYQLGLGNFIGWKNYSFFLDPSEQSISRDGRLRGGGLDLKRIRDICLRATELSSSESLDKHFSIEKIKRQDREGMEKN